MKQPRHRRKTRLMRFKASMTRQRMGATLVLTAVVAAVILPIGYLVTSQQAVNLTAMQATNEVPAVANAPAPQAEPAAAAPADPAPAAADPASQPPAAPAPAETTPAAPAPSCDYTVRDNDVLSSIAAAHGTKWQKIYEANRDRISDPDIIRAGQVLKIPSPCPPPTEPAPAPKPAPAPAPAEAASAQAWFHPFPDFTKCTSGFGPRWGSQHGGVDLADGRFGSPIHAIADGIVTDARAASGYGFMIRIRHENGVVSEYGHMPFESFAVKKGDRVKGDQEIAEVGNKGRSTGPHLHLTLKDKSGERIDPEPFLAERGIELCNADLYPAPPPEPPAPAPEPEPAPAPAPDVSAARLAVWDRLAECESGGDWSINTGNGYYGGIQFSLSSWRTVGGEGYPHEASKAEQIKRGEMLQDLQGWNAWPACSNKLGLHQLP